MIRNACYVAIFEFIVTAVGVVTLGHNFAIGPITFGLTFIFLTGLFSAKRRLIRAITALLFGATDTSLLTTPAFWGSVSFAVIGAIAVGVIGDESKGGIACFYERGIAKC